VLILIQLYFPPKVPIKSGSNCVSWPPPF